MVHFGTVHRGSLPCPAPLIRRSVSLLTLRSHRGGLRGRRDLDRLCRDRLTSWPSCDKLPVTDNGTQAEKAAKPKANNPVMPVYLLLLGSNNSLRFQQFILQSTRSCPLSF